MEDRSGARLRQWLSRILIGLAIVLVIAVPVLTFLAGRESASGDDDSNAATSSEFDFNTLNEILQILHNDYAKPENLDDQTLYEAAIQGMLDVLNDSGTYYVDEQTYEVQTKPDLSGGFDGIGATISEQDGEIVIVAPIKDTPAERAGLVSGDVIVSVNGEPTTGWTVEKAVLQIRGPSGSPVVLTIRHADGSQEDYEIIRARVEVESVTTIAPGGALRDANDELVEDLGYLQIQEFTPNTAQEVNEALQGLVDQGVQGIILDLRNNLGGSLATTISTVDLLLDEGTILIQRNADGRETSYVARQGQIAAGLPIVVLQNRFSASASEIVAAALQENERATVIGEVSFGKGTVNTPRELEDGGALFVTIAQWLTPTGALIDKVGVRPDIEVVPSDEDIDLRRDVQLHRAIEVLRGQVRAP